VSDLYYDNVALLLPFDGADGATAATDYSPTPKTVTFAGNAQLDTANKKWGNASLLLDGTGDYLSIPDHADWDLGTGDYTVEAWVYLADTTGSGVVVQIGTYTGATSGAVWYIENGKLTVFQNNVKYQAA
jgi:hypothetical protein